MEERLDQGGRTAEQASMEELESLWQQAKTVEKAKAQGEDRTA